MVVFLSHLNDLEIWGVDVGNAYLEAYTDEKLCIIAGPEFKELQGHLLIMIKALYGTHSGGARWHDRLFDILQELKFKPSKADPDVWMRPERIVRYLLFLPDGAFRFRTGEPDFSSLKDQEYDWTRSFYSGACEQIPHEIPKPLGKHVQTTHYVDANLHHDLATGKAITAALHFLNQTPIDAYTKRQSKVETATYGSEFVAARTAVDQIIDVRTTLRYLGVPIRDKSYMFGDNRSVVTGSTIPNSTISKRHHLASNY